MKSIIQDKKECYLCRKIYGKWVELPENGLEDHHIFGGVANRPLSEKYGLKVWLCPQHHRGTQFGVHFNAETMKLMHTVGQQAFEKEYLGLSFEDVFGKNYLEEGNEE